MIKLIHGDCLNVLKKIESESINCVITSPPYWNLRDYQTDLWEGGNIDCDHKIPINEVDPKNPQGTSHNVRFIKENCYKCGAKRIDKQIGLESDFRTYIINLCDIFDEIKRILKKDGTCFVNLGDTYMNNSSYSNSGRQGYGNDKIGMIYKKDNKVSEKSLCCIPDRFKIEMVDRGWICRNEIIWKKPNSMPSSVKDRFTCDFEKIFFFTKSKKYWFKQQLEPYVKQINRWGGNKLKSNGKSDWDNGTGQNTYRYRNLRTNDNGRNKRCVWSIPTRPFKGQHFATFPELLIDPILKAGCPEDGIVLDCFFGAGTTGVVAKKQNKRCIGIELNKEYIKIAEKRIKNTQVQEELF